MNPPRTQISPIAPGPRRRIRSSSTAVSHQGTGKPTVPTLMGEEKKANVFLRADDPSVAAKLHMKGASAAEVFGELRERKNKF